MKRSILLPLILSMSVGLAGGVSGATSFAYTIDEQPVLLYKIIQWWYDAPASEAPWVCGRTLACRTVAAIEVTYAE